MIADPGSSFASLGRGGRLVRGLSGGGRLRVLAVVAPGAVEEARARHGLGPVAADALGRALCGALLLTGLIKGAQQVTLVVRGDGPLGGIMADARPAGEVRGYVQEPTVHLPPRDGHSQVGRAVGRGTLTVTRWLDTRPEPYHGTVDLVTGGIARDVAEYLIRSEQVPSAVALGVALGPSGQVLGAGGYLVQPLPGAEDGLLDAFEDRLASLPRLSGLMAEGDLDAERLARLVTGPEHGFRLQGGVPVRFACGCDRDRVEGALVALGSEDVDEMAAGAEPVDVTCRFCSEVYRLEPEELRSLAERMGRA